MKPQWWWVFAVAVLIIVGSLAFEHSSFEAPVRLGVLTGSLVSGLCGYLLLRFAPLPALAAEDAPPRG